MEQSEAKLFASLETELLEQQQDISHVLHELDCTYRHYYDKQFAEYAAYDDLTLTTIVESFLPIIANHLTEQAVSQYETIAEVPHIGDTLSVEIDTGVVFYESFDELDKSYDPHDLREGQQLSGEFVGLTTIMYIPENRLLTLAQEGEEAVLNEIAHPFGLHLILSNPAIEGLDEDDYRPVADEWIYIPIHYGALRLIKKGE